VPRETIDASSHPGPGIDVLLVIGVVAAHQAIKRHVVGRGGAPGFNVERAVGVGRSTRTAVFLRVSQ
jgi:hypothetical protein